MTIKEQLIIDIIKLQNPHLIESLYSTFKSMINQSVNVIDSAEDEDLSVWDDIIKDTYRERRESAKIFH
ncbi:hypothetical protein [Bernardetia sp.]|uniref:hypothetical protein n=1 Tax=Bernardetia sp. TaxID=1937974 RepID=UPI0025C22660|nr:hypothetical protein [Bernardetia sp.]